MTVLAFPQEGLLPLSCNLNYIYKDLKPVEVNPDEPGRHRSASAPLPLPFREDFYYSTTRNYPDQQKWSDSAVYVNSGFAIAPPSIGVATFDGLNKYGYPYDPTSANVALSRPADVLTSQPIALGDLDPASKVALSFYYQAKGNGDTPETSDSLIVDFYRPAQGTWKTVWHTRGISSPNYNDTTFKYAFIKIDSAVYFNDGFRFRFRNWAATSGNFDHWNVDYIFLNHNRVDSVDTTRYDNDVTIAHVPTPFLRDYSAMPLRQYNPNEMAGRHSVRIRNNNETQRNTAYRYKVYDESLNAQIFESTEDYDNVKPFRPHGYYANQRLANPLIEDTFLLSAPDAIDYRIKHFIYPYTSSTVTATDDIPGNDTVVQFLRFRNYYALDDGSAEAGYYVTGAKAKMAVKIRVNVFDTLRALRIYFDPAGNINSIGSPTSIYKFRIYVWGDNNGMPGSIVHGDSSWLIPKFINGEHDPFIEYPLNPRKVLSPGTYYIGFQQQSFTGTVTVGFDKNYNHKTALFYDSGNGWAQSSKAGSIMLRPVIGKHIPPPVGLNENALSDDQSFLVYPNPSSDQFTIRSQKPENSSYRLMNAVGQIVKEEKIRDAEHTVFTGTLSSGIYFLILNVNDRPARQQKIIIQH